MTCGACGKKQPTVFKKRQAENLAGRRIPTGHEATAAATTNRATGSSDVNDNEVVTENQPASSST